jgi:oxepin-CoA hydrolase/3-oxo-5,6-dehydrosuberyl-CoA semialdehyde dehydrogenase
MTEPDLSLGASHRGNSRTITDAEIAFLPALMGANSPLFHDEETARESPTGRRVLYGPALLGIAIAGTEPLLHGTVIALLGIDEVRFRRAVGAGDTVTPTLTIDERIAKPDKPGDLLLISDRVHDQHGNVVMEFQRTIMVRRSP